MCLGETAASGERNDNNDSDDSNDDKLALLWGEAQKKIAYSYLKVT